MKHNSFNARKLVLLGTYHNLTFYYWRGIPCVRTKSTLSRKRVKKAAAFRITMQYAERLGRASKIASKVYRQLPDGWRLLYLYRKMTGLGARLLRMREQSAREIETALWQYLAAIGFKAAEHDMVPGTPELSCSMPIQSPSFTESWYRFGNVKTSSFMQVCGHAKTQRRKNRLCVARSPAYIVLTRSQKQSCYG